MKGNRGVQTELGMSLNAGNANQYPVLKKQRTYGSSFSQNAPLRNTAVSTFKVHKTQTTRQFKIAA